jgi:hypothetical protein
LLQQGYLRQPVLHFGLQLTQLFGSVLAWHCAMLLATELTRCTIYTGPCKAREQPPRASSPSHHSSSMVLIVRKQHHVQGPGVLLLGRCYSADRRHTNSLGVLRTVEWKGHMTVQ